MCSLKDKIIFLNIAFNQFLCTFELSNTILIFVTDPIQEYRNTGIWGIVLEDYLHNLMSKIHIG